MNVQLITHTTGAIGSDYEGKTLDEIVVGIARLSTSKEGNESQIKLVMVGNKVDTIYQYKIK